eukprot:scaffold74050_cov37-Tisochrysis_lutea.AAC.3
MYLSHVNGALPLTAAGSILSGKLTEYMQLLVDAFNPATLDALMCRTHLSVAYDGTLYDCDFNLALGNPIPGCTPSSGMGRSQQKRTIFDIGSINDLQDSRVVTGSHCFGCTAGSGSS